MRLIVIRDESDSPGRSEMDLLRSALSVRPLSNAVLSGMIRLSGSADGNVGFSELAGGVVPNDVVWAFPSSWPRDPLRDFERDGMRVVTDGADIGWGGIRKHPWFVFSNGRFVAHISDRLVSLLAKTSADAVAVTVDPGLLAYRERIRLTEDGELVGYRRLYRDGVEPTPMPTDWPQHLFLRSKHAEGILREGLPHAFDEMVDRCRSRGMRMEAVSLGGSVADLSSAEGLLVLCDAVLAQWPPAGAVPDTSLGARVYVQGGDTNVSREARIIGPVLIGDGVCIEPGAAIVGPSILCDGCTVRRAAIVDSSIVGPQAVVESEGLCHRSVVIGPDGEPPIRHARCLRADGPWRRPAWRQNAGVFRTWPRFSYAGGFKRIADIVAATIVLVLFAPVVPLIALAIKINSPGPVFYKDKRQGLHGRLFGCVKFRTMRVGAAEIQDKLRFVSEVDGPQFKMADDPRISTVGHFLRETYLDEIPQFFNVLCGQMSIVGPRPSPETENTLCPSWRDARLSVRPGITGLWQVYRTREPFRDFQEWIYYDTKYVQELSPQMDLWVCWCTFRKMVENFIRQF